MINFFCEKVFHTFLSNWRNGFSNLRKIITIIYIHIKGLLAQWILIFSRIVQLTRSLVCYLMFHSIAWKVCKSHKLREEFEANQWWYLFRIITRWPWLYLAERYSTSQGPRWRCKLADYRSDTSLWMKIRWIISRPVGQNHSSWI